MGEISIVPVNGVDPRLLSRLGSCLEERFLHTFIVRAPLRIPKSALNSVRKQMFFGSLAARVAAAYPARTDLLLAVTDFDLYKTSHSFIFGASDESKRCAIVSIHRLRSEFYGETASENLLFQRVLKESVHELGHALGLKHCFNARCAMYFSNSIYDTDNKSAQFCDSCGRRSRASRSR